MDVDTEEQKHMFTVTQREMEDKDTRVRNWRLLRSNSHLEVKSITFEIGGRFNSLDNFLVLALGGVNLQQGPRLLPFEFLYRNGWRASAASEVHESLKKMNTSLTLESVNLVMGFKSEVFADTTAL